MDTDLNTLGPALPPESGGENGAPPQEPPGPECMGWEEYLEWVRGQADNSGVPPDPDPDPPGGEPGDE